MVGIRGVTKVNQFSFDNTWQQGIRDALLKPFYKMRAFEGRFIFADKGKLADILQKEMEVDTILQRKENEILLAKSTSKKSSIDLEMFSKGQRLQIENFIKEQNKNSKRK